MVDRSQQMTQSVSETLIGADRWIEYPRRTDLMYVAVKLEGDLWLQVLNGEWEQVAEQSIYFFKAGTVRNKGELAAYVYIQTLSINTEAEFDRMQVNRPFSVPLLDRVTKLNGRRISGVELRELDEQAASLVHRLQVKEEKSKPIQDPDFLRKSKIIWIRRFIRQNYNKPLSLSLLAELFECNPVYLTNTYNKIFNIPLMKDLQRIRMEKAAEMLLYSKKKISDIAKDIGYVSSSQFITLFKRHYKETPYSYRKEGCGNDRSYHADNTGSCYNSGIRHNRQQDYR
ncbi:AraC-type DNA-binding protein [Paenibacillus sp. UNCCL117]|nr:AraC-type DNA-binding protein [Paenibacillus sp. cl123]SFW69764.1 AraC-type DNA-binding protein [Paenibacillus sp. UNCCL117]